MKFQNYIHYLFFYSDAGNGLNYNYIKIRGFSDKYISALINDIPTNDIESEEEQVMLHMAFLLLVAL